MFHAETKILSLPLTGSTGICTTSSAACSDNYGSTQGGCCVLIVFVHYVVETVISLVLWQKYK